MLLHFGLRLPKNRPFGGLNGPRSPKITETSAKPLWDQCPLGLLHLLRPILCPCSVPKLGVRPTYLALDLGLRWFGMRHLPKVTNCGGSPPQTAISAKSAPTMRHLAGGPSSELEFRCAFFINLNFLMAQPPAAALCGIVVSVRVGDVEIVAWCLKQPKIHRNEILALGGVSG